MHCVTIYYCTFYYYISLYIQLFFNAIALLSRWSGCLRRLGTAKPWRIPRQPFVRQPSHGDSHSMCQHKVDKDFSSLEVCFHSLSFIQTSLRCLEMHLKNSVTHTHTSHCMISRVFLVISQWVAHGGTYICSMDWGLHYSYRNQQVRSLRRCSEFVLNSLFVIETNVMYTTRTAS